MVKEKNTHGKQAVLEVLRSSAMPLSVVQIAEALKGKGVSLWPSSIYRILERAVKNGQANKSMLQDDGRYFYEWRDASDHVHHLVCRGCQRIERLSHCPLSHVEAPLSHSGFQVTGHKLEWYGYCSDCAKNKKT